MIGIVVDVGTGDLLVENGGLVMGETSHQVIEHALRAFRGEDYHPCVGQADGDTHRGCTNTHYERGEYQGY